MAEPPIRPDPCGLLRRATVRLVDPVDTARWGTGFFVAHDVLLTCWHLVQAVAGREGIDPLLLVEWPGDGQGAEGSLPLWKLGEARLLEAGTSWDLALLRFTPVRAEAAAGQAATTGPGALPVVPLRLEDPPPGAQLFITAFPKDAAGRHDATYEAAGRTTPEGQTMEFLRIKGDGVVPGYSGAALLDRASGGVCAVIARNELPGGARDGGLAVPLKIFREAFPSEGEEVLRRNALERHPGFTAALKRLGRPDWSWPAPLDSAHYRAEIREGFVGRDWLFAEVRAWAHGGPERALLITADFGVGKSAFLAELVDRAHDTPGLESQGKEHVVPETFGDDHRNAWIPIAAHHFCDHATNATLAPGEFVTSVATQLAQALPAYRAALEADDAELLRTRLNNANRDPSSAWDQAVVAPLARIPSPAGPLLLVVDALDEALEHRPDSAAVLTLTIVDLLARHTPRLPAWLRLLATSRDRVEVRGPLGQAFQLRHIDAEQDANLDDIHAYAIGRCRKGDLAEKLAAAHLRPEPLAAKLRELSGGKFLYAVRVLNELATGALPLRRAGDLEQLPAGMEAFYRDTFQRRFPPAEKEAYDLARPLLALLCAQREPLALGTLAALTDQRPAEVDAALERVDDLLLRRPVPTAEGEDWTLRLDHFSLQQWLSERNERGRWRAGSYAVDREGAARRLRDWALAEVEAGQAHRWPYLVRHLASHLTSEERQGVIAGLLGEFTWLEACLRLAGINVLLGDFALAAPSPGLGRLERALSQAAHVLGHENGWQGQEQLASQLLARISFETELSGLLTKAKEWLLNSGSAIPRTASLACHDALIRTIQAGSPGTDVAALAVLADGRIASGSSENIIQLWNPSEGICTGTLKGHTSSITSLLVRNERYIVSSSCDCTIRIWDLQSDECIRPLDNLGSAITCLALVNSSCLASGSVDGSICLWDLNTFTRTDVKKHHLDRVTSLAVLNDGILAGTSKNQPFRPCESGSGQSSLRSCAAGTVSSGIFRGALASGSYDKTILLWNIVNDRFDDGLPRRFHEDEHWISSLAALADGGLISGSSKGTICIWNSLDQIYPNRLIGHHGGVMDLLSLNDNVLVSAGADRRILLWERGNQKYTNDLQEHLRGVSSIKSLPNGQLVSCSSDSTIRLWKLPEATESKMPERHNESILFLKAYSDSVLVSLSGELTVRYWDIASCQCISVVEDHRTWLNLHTELRLSTGHNTVYTQSLFSSNLVQSPGNGGYFHWGSKGDWSNFLPLEISMGRSISIVSQSVVCLAEDTSLDFAPRVIFVADAEITCITLLLRSQLLVTGDSSGRLHWLEMPPPQNTAASKLRPRS